MKNEKMKNSEVSKRVYNRTTTGCQGGLLLLALEPLFFSILTASRKFDRSLSVSFRMSLRTYRHTKTGKLVRSPNESSPPFAFEKKGNSNTNSGVKKGQGGGGG